MQFWTCFQVQQLPPIHCVSLQLIFTAASLGDLKVQNKNKMRLKNIIPQKVPKQTLMKFKCNVYAFGQM